MLLKSSFSKVPTTFIFLLFLFALSLLIIQISCNTTQPLTPPNEQPKDIKLKLLDVSCTEAFINITASDTVLPINLTLNKDDKSLFNFTLTNADTTVIDTTLQAGKTYIYQTTAIINGTKQKSDTLQVKALDTTSHDFSWQTFTFGDADAGSSVFNDVAILNDTSIYAVGEIYLKDSLGNPDPNAYNLVHWNGSMWKLKRIKTNACGGVDYPPIKTILAFSSNDILFAHIDGSITHYNGKEFINDCSLITQLNE